MYQSLSSSKDMIENQELTKDLFLKYNLQMIDTEKLAQKYSTNSMLVLLPYCSFRGTSIQLNQPIYSKY